MVPTLSFLGLFLLAVALFIEAVRATSPAAGFWLALAGWLCTTAAYVILSRHHDEDKVF